MATAADFGAGTDGRRVNDYCRTCYQSGRLVAAFASREEVTARLAGALSARFSIPEREARAQAESIIPGLRRWRGDFDLLLKNWWGPVLRGIVAVLFGIVLLVWPGYSLGMLVIAFGIYAFADGIFAIAAGVRSGTHHHRWGLLIFEGLVGMAAGVVTFVWPAITALALYSVIALWSVITGILEIVAAVRLRRHVSGELWLALSGVSSILFGILLLALPRAGMLALAWIIGIYAIVFGAMLIALGERLRSLGTASRPAEKRDIRGATPQPA